MVSRSKCLFLLTSCLFSIVCFAAHAFAAIPLITDDTGTQGKGGFQLEIPIEYSHDKENGTRAEMTEIGATLTYGVVDQLDIALTLPYQFLRFEDPGSRADENGLSDINIEAKWRLYAKKGISLALKPGFTLPTGDDQKGLGTGKATYYIMLLTTITGHDEKPVRERQGTDETHPRAVKKPSAGEWAIHVNTGYTSYENKFGAPTDIWSLSAAGVLEILDDLKLLSDVGITTDTEKYTYTPPAYLLVGFIYSPWENFDIGVGLKVGLNKPGTAYAYRSGITWRF